MKNIWFLMLVLIVGKLDASEAHHNRLRFANMANLMEKKVEGQCGELDDCALQSYAVDGVSQTHRVVDAWIETVTSPTDTTKVTSDGYEQDSSSKVADSSFMKKHQSFAEEPRCCKKTWLNIVNCFFSYCCCFPGNCERWKLEQCKCCVGCCSRSSDKDSKIISE